MVVAEPVKATMPVTVPGAHPAVYCANPAVCCASPAVWGHDARDRAHDYRQRQATGMVVERAEHHAHGLRSLAGFHSASIRCRPRPTDSAPDRETPAITGFQ
jgi:hypothetical protein